MRIDRHSTVSPPTAAPPRRPRGVWRWSAALLAFALLPKCLVCVFGYVAAAAGFGWLGAEICGSLPNRFVSLVTSPPWLAAGFTAAAILALAALRRPRGRTR